MSPRKPTVDGTDDVDDQDGTLQDEVANENDLTLHVRGADEVALGGDAGTADLNSRMRDLEEEDLEREDLEGEGGLEGEGRE
jgi:hypothetical protein